jgi:hypothetical protein
MTVHWIDGKTRDRKYATLACQRIKGRHTFSVLASAMEAVHCKFNIQDKLTRTTTDNGSNFVKAFGQFSEKPEHLPDIPEPADDSDEEVLPDHINDLIEGPREEADFVESIEVEELLEDNSSSSSSYSLPIHMRCAAHSFNLVATVDSEKALEDISFKSMSRKAMAKAQALWNLQSRSAVAADVIVEGVGRRLVIPNATRWNSTYDAVKVLNDLLASKRKMTLIVIGAWFTRYCTYYRKMFLIYKIFVFLLHFVS